METNDSEDFAASIFKVDLSVKMDTACSSGKSVCTYKITRCHNPEIRISSEFDVSPEIVQSIFRRLRTCVKGEKKEISRRENGSEDVNTERMLYSYHQMTFV